MCIFPVQNVTVTCICTTMLHDKTGIVREVGSHSYAVITCYWLCPSCFSLVISYVLYKKKIKTTGVQPVQRYVRGTQSLCCALLCSVVLCCAVATARGMVSCL